MRFFTTTLILLTTLMAFAAAVPTAQSDGELADPPNTTTPDTPEAPEASNNVTEVPNDAPKAPNGAPETPNSASDDEGDETPANNTAPAATTPSTPQVSEPAIVEANLYKHLTCSVRQCNPSPGLNKCDITTSCITTSPHGQYHCACRAGYKARASNTDTNTHYRTYFVGQEYRVFVKPGVVCNTLCDGFGSDSCGEVTQVHGCN